jgi:GMP synthase (glutamine-hydrolysing)
MILIVDMNSKRDSLGFSEFVLPIVSIVSPFQESVVEHYLELDEKGVKDCDRIVLSGNALKDDVSLRHPKNFDWMRKCEKPTLGICAGMQMIGLVFGCRLKESLGIGMSQIRTVKPNPLFSLAFRAYELHNYTLEPCEAFDVLAESERGVEAVKHRQRQMYGVLFHPEVRNKEIIERFLMI